MTTPLPTLSPGAVKSVIVNSPGDAYTKASEAAGRSDLLLISCDGIRFPTHKAFLGTASTFFKSLLEIGEHASQPSEVKCAETGVELNEVLIFCYPVAAPFLGYHTREGLMKLARVADKLGMIRAVDSFCSALCRKSWLTEHGMELYELGAQLQNTTLMHYARPSAAADPTLLPAFSKHHDTLGLSNSASLLQDAYSNGHLLTPAQVYQQYTALMTHYNKLEPAPPGQLSFSFANPLPDLAANTAQMFFRELSPDMQKLSVANHTASLLDGPGGLQFYRFRYFPQ